MPYGERTLSIDFDFIDHRVVIQDSGGHVRSLPLAASPVCVFHDALFAELAAIGVHVRIGGAPQECPVTTPFADDREHASYDADRGAAVLASAPPHRAVFQTFRSRFRGKCSPVHFFWGAFDLAVSRFNGGARPAQGAGRPRRVRRGGHLARVLAGDPWTGATEAMFYSYTVPEPPGLPAHPCVPTRRHSAPR